MSVRSVPILRHPTLGIPMPWLDTRPVPASTLCDYLGGDYSRLDSLAKSGAFSESGCTQTCGEVRPLTYYCPARIWAVNHWTPSVQVMAMLTGKPSRDALRALADQFSAAQRQLESLLGAGAAAEASA